MPVESMLPPENTVPGLPRTGGYAPSPDEALRDFHRQRQWADMAKYARLHDPTVNMLTALAANYIAKGNKDEARQLINTDSMKVVRELSSIGSSWGLFGGNPVNMMAGINQFAGSSQFRVSSNMFGGRAQLFGGGMVSDMFSRQLFDNVQANFLSRNTGMPDRNKTFGFNKDQMGDIFALMGSRRMFSGMDAGSMNFNEATKQYSATFNPNTLKGINETFTQTAKLLANVRDIVGNRSIGELARVAEQVSGLSMRGSSSPAVMNQRLERLRGIAGVMGVDKESFLRAHMSTTAMGAPIYGRSLASSMSLNAWDRAGAASLDRNADVSNARAQGRYRYSWDEQELAQIGMKDQMQALAENPLLAEALFIQQNVNNGNEGGRAALGQSVKDYGNASSPAERVAATKAIANAIQNYTGASAGTAWRELGPGAILRGLSPESMDQLSGTLSDFSQNMNRNVLRRYIAKGVIGGVSGMNVDDATSAAFFFKRGLDSDQQSAVMEAIASGDMSKVRAIVGENVNDINAAGLGGDMDKFLSMSKDKNFSRFLGNVGNVTQGDRQLANMESIGGRRRANEKALGDWYWSNTVGDSRMGSEGGLMSFARALVGGNSVIDNGMLVRYSQTGGRDKFSEMAVSGFGDKLTGDQVSQMRKVLGTYKAGGLEAALGLGTNASDDQVRQMLMTSGGARAKMQFMKDAGVVFSSDHRGETILGKGTAARTREALEMGQRVYERAVLTGNKMTDEKAVKALEAQIIDEDKTIRGMASNPEAAQKVLAERNSQLEKFLSNQAGVSKAIGDPDSDEFQALSTLSKRDSAAFQKAMGAARKSIGASKATDEEKTKQMSELRALEEKLSASTKPVQPVMLVPSSIADLGNVMRGGASRTT